MMIKVQRKKINRSLMVLSVAFIIVLIYAVPVSASRKIKVGTVFKQDGQKYKVTSLQPRTVEFVGVYGKDWEMIYEDDEEPDELWDGIKIGGSVFYKGKSYKVTSIASNAMRGNKKVEVVEIDKTIISVGESAFEGCKNLVEVQIGKNVKSIGEKSFYNCKKLEDIYINSKKLKYVGDAAFKKIKKGGCIRCPEKYKKLIKGKLGA